MIGWGCPVRLAGGSRRLLEEDAGGLAGALRLCRDDVQGMPEDSHRVGGAQVERSEHAHEDLPGMDSAQGL